MILVERRYSPHLLNTRPRISAADAALAYDKISRIQLDNRTACGALFLVGSIMCRAINGFITGPLFPEPSISSASVDE